MFRNRCENVQVRKHTFCDTGDIRHEVVGDTVGIIADKPARMGADGIEVAQKYNGKAFVAHAQILKYAFYKQLCSAVGICCGKREILAYRDTGGFAVNRCAGRKDQLEAFAFAHFEQQIECSGNVVMVIFKRLCHRFSHGLQPRKMNDGIYIVLVKYLCYRGAVEQIRLVKHGAHARDLFDAVDNARLGIGKVVEYNYLLPLFDKLHTGVGADIAGSAGNKNAHKKRLRDSIISRLDYSAPQRLCQASKHALDIAAAVLYYI